MDDYVMKPIRAEQLFEALEQIGAGTISIAGNGTAGKWTPGTGRIDWKQTFEGRESRIWLCCGRSPKRFLKNARNCWKNWRID